MTLLSSSLLSTNLDCRHISGIIFPTLVFFLLASGSIGLDALISEASCISRAGQEIN